MSFICPVSKQIQALALFDLELACEWAWAAIIGTLRTALWATMYWSVSQIFKPSEPEKQTKD